MTFQAWQRSGCDQGSSLRLHVCRNLDQISTASQENRTCSKCGQEFSSRNQLMRHLHSTGHFEEEVEKSSTRVVKATETKDLAQNEEKLKRRKVWELYYQDLPEFDKVNQLMQTFVPYCFRTVPTSPLARLALSQLQAETALKRPQGLLPYETSCDCWGMGECPSDVWTFLHAAQESGAIQRQEAASMVPVTLLEASQLQHAVTKR